MKTFSEKDPAEKVFVVFDFSKTITNQVETITAASFAVEVITGVDATPSAILNGSPVFKAKEASILIIGGVAGVDYKITCTVDTNKNQRFLGIGQLPVRSQA